MSFSMHSDRFVNRTPQEPSMMNPSSTVTSFEVAYAKASDAFNAITKRRNFAIGTVKTMEKKRHDMINEFALYEEIMKSSSISDNSKLIAKDVFGNLSLEVIAENKREIQLIRHDIANMEMELDAIERDLYNLSEIIGIERSRQQNEQQFFINTNYHSMQAQLAALQTELNNLKGNKQNIGTTSTHPTHSTHSTVSTNPTHSTVPTYSTTHPSEGTVAVVVPRTTVGGRLMTGLTPVTSNDNTMSYRTPF